MTEATEEAVAPAGLTITDQPWKDPEVPPPTNLPYDDGDKMESPWHFGNATLLLANYMAARGGRRDDFYIGANMFIYYSSKQVRNLDYRGPDVFIVKNVDPAPKRLSWVVWEEDGRYPDVIFELLSDSTEKEDLGKKKTIYEQTFRTPEYFCISPEVTKLLGWRLVERRYVPIQPNEQGWLWSKELDLWIGAWHGTFLTEEHTWVRFYTPDGDLVLLRDEAALLEAQEERQRAEEERQRAEEERQRAQEERQRAQEERQRAETAEQRVTDMTARMAELEAELQRLRGEAGG